MEKNQKYITDYFEISSFAATIDESPDIRSEINSICGLEKTASVKPVLNILYENAKQNSLKSKTAHQHNDTVMDFATSLKCLVGKSGYEFIQTNLGNALPSVSTVNRKISQQTPIKEGEFLFKDVKRHLLKWDCPPYIHIHVDDTRVLNRVEYDSVTDRFVGLCLPINRDSGLPECNAFVLHTFGEIKEAYDTGTISKYAHCVVAKPVTAAPAFVFFVLGTDSSYNHEVIGVRWNYITTEFSKIGITVLTFGADGAGPFIKTMITEGNLFKRGIGQVPESWTFYLMNDLKKKGLYVQDFVHLLAKMRTRLLLPSNILVLGNETACSTHMNLMVNKFSKEEHGLSIRSIDIKDKQNYSSIELMLKEGVFQCLLKLGKKINTTGTIMYLNLMKNIRDAFLNKSISPRERLYLSWKTLYFFRIWRVWLKKNGYNELDHFVSGNVYVCLELNCHMLINLIYNVIRGIFPPESLRTWLSGSQGCEETFRMLRSMTPTFSTIVNFSIKGIIQRIHKLNHLSSVESSESITFPRVQRRLLHFKEEGKETLSMYDLSLESLESLIAEAKNDAVKLCEEVGMVLEGYDDMDLVCHEIAIENAILNDGEEEDTVTSEGEHRYEQEEVRTIKEDLSNIRLHKTSSDGLPKYDLQPTTNSVKKGKTYKTISKRGNSPFVKFNDKYIRKSTVLYLIQEKMSLSNDRLLRVREEQPAHIFSTSSSQDSEDNYLQCGSLCIFRRVDNDSRYLVGRAVQFSYLEGSKKERQYSSSYVDLSKESFKNIGVFCNWYNISHNDSETLFFQPIDIFTPGYLSLEYFYRYLPDSLLADEPDCSFAIRIDAISGFLEDWRALLSPDLLMEVD